MAQFKQGAVIEIPNSKDDVFAFEVKGDLDTEDSSALASHVNELFDAHPSINMLVDLSAFSGKAESTLLDKDVFTSRLRALGNVERYAVVGAPEAAAKMIKTMDKVIPVKAATFASDQIAEAWAFVGAEPLETED
ncbi:STAS/SEC14 domain-containing protein [Yoonia litorea]|uniref:SpoIIAA-like n=1 Tax=Yoonia litorea TaxID=1123755 RepID=A0A1I6MZT6_9RHOB|nr:STAS/SEC14 domain-containing protein [Yoonia litorea]SFS21210.1 SpoIIAA-like [Yoonia litorea]